MLRSQPDFACSSSSRLSLMLSFAGERPDLGASKVTGFRAQVSNDEIHVQFMTENHQVKLHVDLGLQFVEHPPSLHTLPRQAAVALLAMLQSYRKKSIYMCYIHVCTASSVYIHCRIAI